MVVPAFAWLHLTDLHQGMWSQGWLWPNVREAFLDDLERLHDRCGPWQVVAFTGDLTQRGSAEEFERLDETLGELSEHLARLGSTPALLAVPGNHDLVRPKRMRAVHRLIANWEAQPDVHTELWDDEESEYREALEAIFEPFCAWWTKRMAALPEDWSVRAGVLPGDWSVTIPHHGRKLGFLGLNSAYVQLAEGDFHGKLHLDVRQFHGACEGDGPRWAKAHDLAFLLTHHGPDWLGQDGLGQLRGEIDVPPRFFAHLYGHMHEQAQYAQSEGGAATRRRWQGPSMFGLEQVGETLERAHGYTAGRIEFEDTLARVRLWPRSAVQTQAGPWRLGVDRKVVLDEDGGTRSELLELASLAPPPSASATLRRGTLDASSASSSSSSSSRIGASASASGSLFQKPGQRYDPRWHVVHDEEESWAVDSLLDGVPVAVCAPLHFGKTWFLERVLETIGRRSPALEVAYVDLNLADSSSLERLLAGVARQVGRAVGIDDMPWPERGSPQGRLIEALETHVAPATKEGLVLTLDLPDSMWEFAERDGFFRVMRVLSGQGNPTRWKWLRILLAFSMAPSLYIDSVAQSPWNVPEVRLDEFTPQQIEDLARRHDLSWGPAELDALRGSVGGHPFMVRHALYEVARSGRPLDDVLADDEIDFHLRRLENLLGRDPQLCESACRLIAGERVDLRHRQRLEAAGLIRWDKGQRRYLARFPIYSRLFERLCR
ncbi:Extracellular ligand-binding receptor [Plesiocystis pacifica SIR-1]|uniref:Extracellular ligand-binding receptor n=1 Tax=Plesiocystis pacifica SIR-1 TaxID=391625 RepID=A6FYV8_9BACT|nr:AAA-like domain-containing protein [Plesiocystis pacifica]EDM81113.1 Extracellular ligand-binding receptor [Plesiocystis pacifica SIR-1]